MKIKNIAVLFIILILLLSSCNSEEIKPGKDMNIQSNGGEESDLNSENIFQDINYIVLDMEKSQPNKCILTIRLENRIKADEIHQIAWAIENSEGADCAPLFIFYYLPNETPGVDIPWASSHFNPTLDIKINKADLETITKLEASVPTSDENIIGTWIDEGVSPHIVVIEKIDDLFQTKEIYSDGSEWVKPTEVKIINGEERYYVIGYYMVVLENGNLALFDGQGYIYELEPK